MSCLTFQTDSLSSLRFQKRPTLTTFSLSSFIMLSDARSRLLFSVQNYPGYVEESFCPLNTVMLLISLLISRNEPYHTMDVFFSIGRQISMLVSRFQETTHTARRTFFPTDEQISTIVCLLQKWRILHEGRLFSTPVDSFPEINLSRRTFFSHDLSNLLFPRFSPETIYPVSHGRHAVNTFPWAVSRLRVSLSFKKLLLWHRKHLLPHDLSHPVSSIFKK